MRAHVHGLYANTNTHVNATRTYSVFSYINAFGCSCATSNTNYNAKSFVAVGLNSDTHMYMSEFKPIATNGCGSDVMKMLFKKQQEFTYVL